MSFLKILLLLVLAAFGVHLWHARHHNANLHGPITYAPGVFTHMAMPRGAEKNKVLILAPLNCPSAAAQRANALAEQLTKMGIPTVRGNSASLRISGTSTEERDDLLRTAKVLNGEIPAVFVNGMGKSNPSPDEVAQTYRQTQ